MKMNLEQLDEKYSATLRIQPGDGLTGRLAVIMAHSGDSWFWLAGLFILWLAVQGEWHVRAAMLAAGIVAQAVLVLLIKFTVRRSRPPGEWGAIYRNADPHSFPSGHAARAFLLVAMVWGLGPGWLFWVLLIWAPLVCLARVALGVHYLSDMVAGLGIGLLIGIIMLLLQPLLVAFFPFVF